MNTVLQPIVSIIVPVYNVENYLCICMESLMQQTLQDIEIICINDGSTDSSGDILKKLDPSDKRLIIIEQKNAGLSAARNTGMRHARGRYIMFCDSDDFYAPDMCALMVGTMEEKQVDLVMCNTHDIITSADRQQTDPAYYFPFAEGIYKIDTKILQQINVVVWNKIYRKDIIDRYSLQFPEGLKFEDNYFTFAYLSAADHLFCLDKTLYFRTIRDGSIIDDYLKHSNPEDVLHPIQVIDKLYHFLLKNNIWEKVKDAFAIRMYTLVYDGINNLCEQSRDVFFTDVKKLIEKIDIQHYGNEFHDAIISCISQGYYESAMRLLGTEYVDLQPFGGTQSVNIVFSIDSAYVAYFSVVLQSLIDHMNPHRSYDLIVLQHNLKADDKAKLERIVVACENIHLRFLNIGAYHTRIAQFNVGGHISVSSYYRLVIASILKKYSKILYLDSDIIIQKDVAELFDTDLQGYSLGACLDAAITAPKGTYGIKHRDLIQNAGLAQPEHYFNAGILLMDLHKIRTRNIEELFLSIATRNDLPLFDQDVLNLVCHHDWITLHPQWNYNYTIHLDAITYLHPQIKASYLQMIVERDFNIIHYVSACKPWFYPNEPLSEIWWKYARKSPYYESLLTSLLSFTCSFTAQNEPHHSWIKDIKTFKKKYRKCKILSRLLWGKKRTYYSHRKQEFKQKIQQLAAKHPELEKRKYWWRYKRYTFLSIILWGRQSDKYAQKTKYFKQIYKNLPS